MMMKRHALTDSKRSHKRPHADNRAGGLMTENARWRHRAELDFLYVSWTNAARSHLHEHLVGADAGNRQSFHAQIVDTSIDNRSHRLWEKIYSHGAWLIGKETAARCNDSYLGRSNAGPTEMNSMENRLVFDREHDTLNSCARPSQR
jgi:hypothetical protein